MRDVDIRQALREQQLRQHSDDPSTRVIEELGLCQGDARIDIAVVNGRMNGIEIKSEKDTLGRLRGQAEVYGRIFDYVSIVTAGRHLKNVLQIVPMWWGIIHASESQTGINFLTVRRPKLNSEIDAYSLVQLLWKDEAENLLKQLGRYNGLSGKPRAALWQALADNVPRRHLQDVVREKLKNRTTWRVDW